MKHYYALYNSILALSFPPTEQFVVAPQLYPKDSNESIDFCLEYDVFIDNKLIGFIDIKPEYYILNISHRILADEQMRRRFRQIHKESQLDILIGISAMGTRCSVYRLDRRSNKLLPEAIKPTIQNVVEDLAPVSWWNINISNETGRNQLSQVFLEIKTMVS